ncbi:MAG: ferrochelatase, partial [Elusimicrobia bacterium]|nr:ferrochelatase [Candidatus Obscuribacterium magneticum]
MSRVILLLNFGGPETLADVKDFLFRLFDDPWVLRIPFTPLRKCLAWLLSRGRESFSREMYAKIGGGSPLKRLTESQREALAKLLRESGKQAEIRTLYSCSPPFIEDVIRDASEKGLDTFL